MNQEFENNELIARWLSGDLSEAEKEQLSKLDGLEDLDRVLSDVSAWQLPKPDVESRLKEIQAIGKEKPEAKVISLRPLLRYAAAIVLLVSVWFVYDRFSASGLIELDTQVAEVLEHDLPNGSVVTLGAMSELSYDEDEWSNSRSLTLDGQAFFDVTKGVKFEVETDQGIVTVLGTEFDVKVSDARFEVNCFEGRVMVMSGDNSEIIQPGEGVVLANSQLNRISFTGRKPSWISGSSSFKEAKLSAVIVDLKRYYEVTIELPDNLKDLTFTGQFTHDNLASALRSIFVPLEVDYELTDEGSVVFQ